MAGKSQFGLWIPPVPGTSFLPIAGRIVGRIGGERNGCREVCNVDIQTCVDDDCLSELPPKPEPRTKFP
jgi:hypothetical protein